MFCFDVFAGIEADELCVFVCDRSCESGWQGEMKALYMVAGRPCDGQASYAGKDLRETCFRLRDCVLLMAFVEGLGGGR